MNGTFGILRPYEIECEWNHRNGVGVGVGVDEELLVNDTRRPSVA